MLGLLNNVVKVGNQYGEFSYLKHASSERKFCKIYIFFQHLKRNFTHNFGHDYTDYKIDEDNIFEISRDQCKGKSLLLSKKFDCNNICF